MGQAQFVKHNKAKLKAGTREESAKILLDFFSHLQGKVKGMAGYVIMDNINDEQETIVLTFWNTKEEMVPSIGQITRHCQILSKNQSLILISCPKGQTTG
jgi:hypothetical protein